MFKNSTSKSSSLATFIPIIESLSLLKRFVCVNKDNYSISYRRLRVQANIYWFFLTGLKTNYKVFKCIGILILKLVINLIIELLN